MLSKGRSVNQVTSQGGDVGQHGRGASPFGLWADPVLVLALLALWIALALVFNGEPEIDRWVSSLFFTVKPCAQGSQAIVCGGFPAGANVALATIRSFFHYLPVVVARRRRWRYWRAISPPAGVSPTDVFALPSRRSPP